MSKILGVKAISGDVFYGNVKNGVIDGRSSIIPKQTFENCMIEFIYHYKDEWKGKTYIVTLNGKDYKLSINLEEMLKNKDKE